MRTNPAPAAETNKPRRLGRGLSALIGQPIKVEIPQAGSSAPALQPAPAKNVPAHAPREPSTPALASTDAAPGTRVAMLPLDAIKPGRFQPRRVFDEAQLKELAASIASAGVVQPVVVRSVTPSAAGAPRYELIAGERRWRACGIAGVSAIPAVVQDISDEQAAEWSLIENLQRTDLTSMERAEAVASLCSRFSLSHQQAAEKLGIDRSSVANMVRLLELEEPIRELLDEGKLSGGHGKALLAAPPGQARINLANIAANQGWSVRKLEQAAANALVPSGTTGASVTIPASDKAMAKAAALRDLEKQLGEHMGTAVAIRASGSGKRGSIVLKFYDLDHFDGLMSKMGFRLR